MIVHLIDYNWTCWKTIAIRHGGHCPYIRTISVMDGSDTQTTCPRQRLCFGTVTLGSWKQQMTQFASPGSWHMTPKNEDIAAKSGKQYFDSTWKRRRTEKPVLCHRVSWIAMWGNLIAMFEIQFRFWGPNIVTWNGYHVKIPYSLKGLCSLIVFYTTMIQHIGWKYIYIHPYCMCVYTHTHTQIIDRAL